MISLSFVTKSQNLIHNPSFEQNNNPEVWRRTHEHCGKLWFYSSLACIMIILFISEDYINWIFIPYITFIAIYPIVYSYILFRKIGNLKLKE